MGAGHSGDVGVTFTLTLDNDETVELTNCFSTWPQSTSASCTATSSGDTTTTATTAAASGGSDCAAEWQQCAGNDFADKCCAAGTQCFKQSEWYSQCVTDCPAGWACNNGRRRLRGAK